MPSRVADDLWHEFILDTKSYHAFCERAFGGYFHHIPAAQMAAGISSNAALRLTWRHACLEENINPKKPVRLPLLFAIDAKLGIANGNAYSLSKPDPALKSGEGVCGGSGFVCQGDGLAGGGSGADASGGDGGCGDGGGGCGGGGEETRRRLFFDHGGAGASTSRLPLDCSGPTTPADSISSTSRAARL